MSRSVKVRSVKICENGFITKIFGLRVNTWENKIWKGREMRGDGLQHKSRENLGA